MIEIFKLTEDLVQFVDSFDTWEQAIIGSAKPLVQGNYISENYVTSMIESIKEHGPYICIVPNIAIPHARPETGSKKIGFSVTILKRAVSFSKSADHNARLLITLSCVNSDTHLLVLQALVGILGNKEKKEKILNAKTKGEVVTLFN